MHTPTLLAATLLVAASTTFAAPAQYTVVDHSSPALIDTAGAVAVWKAQVDDNLRTRLHKLYPVSNWAFVSQVQGGFTSDKVCVVTASALMMPLIRGSRVVFDPRKSATTFASQAGASTEQCRSLAATKLAEAIQAMRSVLIEP